jgi:Raf kinase inhibitor-like YbhB/YbcL family protein
MALDLKSTAFNSEDNLPTKYTCDGAGISPPLAWSGVPDGTKSQVLILDDPDAPGRIFCHWLLYNIPPDVDNLREGASDKLSYEQGRNDFRNIGFGAPCPPVGSTHRYYFRLFALDQNLNIQRGATRQQVIDRIKGHILDQAELMAYFGRARGE